MTDKRIDDIVKRLVELERFLPILRETFAGEIGPPFPSMEDLIKAQIRANAERPKCSNCGSYDPLNHTKNDCFKTMNEAIHYG